MDQVDYKIIELLKADGSLSNTELSKQLFISSQAVGKRRRSLEKSQVISDYTIKSSVYKTAFIEVYMNSSKFSQFEAAIINLDYKLEFHKIAGSYCYLIIFERASCRFDEDLNDLLSVIEEYARYKVNISCKRI